MNALSMLLIFFLNVESSYVQNIERGATGHGDTVQFMLLRGHAWRIKTYAMDQDVHVWSLGPMSGEEFQKLARSNTEKHYGDVLVRMATVEDAGDSVAGLRNALVRSALGGSLEAAHDEAFAFWVPQPGVYATRSKPQ